MALITTVVNPRVILLEDGYCLEVNGRRSEEADYGDPVEFGGFLAFLTVGDDGEVETPLVSTVYQAMPVDSELVDAGGNVASIAPETGSEVLAGHDDEGDETEDGNENESESEEEEIN